MSAPLDPHRGWKFVAHWTLANAIGVSTVIWLAVVLADSVDISILWLPFVLVFFGFGAVAGVQQLILHRYGMPAKWWWAASYVAWAAGALAGMVAEEFCLGLIRNYSAIAPHEFHFDTLGASIVFGLVFGATQMLACDLLYRRIWIWPLACSLAFPPAVAASFSGSETLAEMYFIALLMGALYGMVTGLALSLVRPQQAT